MEAGCPPGAGELHSFDAANHPHLKTTQSHRFAIS